MNKVIFLLFIIFCLVGCSNGVVNIKTDPPDANIFVQTSGGGKIKLGQSPLNISSIQAGIDGKNSSISIEKDGYFSESFIVPASSYAKNVSISTRLKRQELPVSCSIKQEELESLTSGIARTMLLLQSRSLDEAFSVVEKLMVDFPGVSVIYDLAGNINYLQGNTSKALDYYKKSQSIFPGKSETNRMIKKLESIR